MMQAISKAPDIFKDDVPKDAVPKAKAKGKAKAKAKGKKGKIDEDVPDTFTNDMKVFTCEKVLDENVPESLPSKIHDCLILNGVCFMIQSVQKNCKLRYKNSIVPEPLQILKAHSGSCC